MTMTIDFTWQNQANCRGMDTKLFFPTQGESIHSSLVEACESCPVREQCLNHALHWEHYGYWAGTTEKERKRLRKTLKIASHRPESVWVKGTQEEKARAEAARVKIVGRGRKKKNVA